VLFFTKILLSVYFFCSSIAKTRWSSIFYRETGQRISGSVALSIMHFSAVTRHSIIPADVGPEAEWSVEVPHSGTSSCLPDYILIAVIYN